MKSDAVVTTVRGEGIQVADVIVHLKLKGLFRTAIYELIEQKVVEQALRRDGGGVSEAEVDRLAAERRQTLGIADPGTFQRYLNFHGVTAAQWRSSIRLEAERAELMQRVVPPRKVTEAFKRDPDRFASVALARIACRSRDDAERVLAQVKGGARDFVDLAREFSADEHTRLSGGFVGNVKRGILPMEVERQAFAAGGNDILGPFRENGLWTVYKVYQVNVPKLTDALKAVLRDQLFQEWLREQVCTVPA